MPLPASSSHSIALSVLCPAQTSGINKHVLFTVGRYLFLQIAILSLALFRITLSHRSAVAFGLQPAVFLEKCTVVVFLELLAASSVSPPSLPEAVKIAHWLVQTSGY